LTVSDELNAELAEACRTVEPSDAGRERLGTESPSDLAAEEETRNCPQL